MLIKRTPKVDAKQVAGLPAAEDKEWAGWYPVLIEFMTARKWDDGSPRQPGTLSLFAEEGTWKAFVNDKDGERSACIAGGTLEDLFTSIDLGLRNDSLAWRTAKPFKKR